VTGPKLLILVTEDWYFHSHRLALARTAVTSGFEVVVATRIGELRPAIEAAGIRVIDYPFDRRGMNPLRAILDVLRLARLIRSERPDIVHNVALKPVVLGGLACRLSGCRNVVNAIAGMGFLFTERSRAPLVSAIVRILLAMVGSRGVTIVQNPDDGRLLAKAGVPASRIRHLPGVGVDLQAFQQSPEPSGVPVAALPARLLWDKGVAEFVEAARILKSRGVAVRCVLVGMPDKGNPTSVGTEQVAAWVKEGVVEWWGHSTDMPATFSRTSIVCLPSYREGFPKVLAEAAACGRPIVTTDVPGCREVVTDGDNGMLVPPRSAGQLAMAIEALAADRALRHQFGLAGRRRAEREFSSESANASMLRIYGEMLTGLQA